MESNRELDDLIKHIPDIQEYPNSELQISLPTTSSVEPSDALEFIYSYAMPKGWKVEDIIVIRRSGYIACSDCKKKLHIHVSTPLKVMCMNCSSKNLSRTEAKISVVEKE